MPPCADALELSALFKDLGETLTADQVRRQLEPHANLSTNRPHVSTHWTRARRSRLELRWSLLWAVCIECAQIKGIFERADKEHKGALGMEEFLTMLCEFMRSRLKVNSGGKE